MALYSETVMDHFRHPRNVGVIEDADGVGEVGNAKCGDIMKIYLKIDGDVVTDVKFETFGCGSAIASSSMATEMIKGKPVAEAMELTNKAVTEALGEGYVNYLKGPLSFSEDFSYYGNATGTPSLFLMLNAGCLGDEPYSLHDARCTFQENALECGVTAMVATAMKVSRGN